MLFEFMSFMRFTLLTFFCAVALLAGCSETPQFQGAAVDNDQNVLTGGPITGTTLDDLPEPVRATLTQRVPQAEVVSITRSKRDGKVVYDITLANSQTLELYLREDGMVMPDPMRAQK